MYERVFFLLVFSHRLERYVAAERSRPPHLPECVIVSVHLRAVEWMGGKTVAECVPRGSCLKGCECSYRVHPIPPIASNIIRPSLSLTAVVFKKHILEWQQQTYRRKIYFIMCSAIIVKSSLWHLYK